MKPVVSVVLTTLNGASRGYLGEAIESVLAQTERDFELIIVDDGSSDGTAALCANYQGDARVRYLHQDNRGLAAARNFGIREGRGTYVCFLDDDDSWKPHKLEMQLAFIEGSSDPKIGMVYSAIELVDEAGRTVGVQAHSAAGSVFDRLFLENFVDAPSSVLIKRTVLDHVGLFAEHMHSCEDYDLWFRIARCYHIYSVDETLVRYRVHQNKMSTNLKKMEFYCRAALYYASEGRSLTEMDLAYHEMYKKFAVKYYGGGEYAEFIKYFRLAEVYGRSPLELRLKYHLVRLPGLANGLRQVKRQIARSRT